MTMTSEELIKQLFKEEMKEINQTTNFHVVPNIEDKLLLKISEILKNNEFNLDISKVISVINSTNGSSYIIFTGTHSYFKFNDTIKYIDYDSIEKVLLEYNDNDEYFLKITFNNSEEFVIEENIFEKEISLHFLENIYNNLLDKDIKKISNKQFIEFENLSEDTKFSYLKFIVHYLKADDGKIDINETRELASLLIRCKIEDEINRKLREYRFSSNELETYDTILLELKNNLLKENVNYEVIYDSLIFNILSMHENNKLKDWKNNPYLKEVINYLEITDRKIDNLIRMILKQRKMLTERLEDSEYKKYMGEILSIGSAAGVSILALSTMGTVTGFGFGFGISSGLLGLGIASGGTLFGLAAVGLAGYGMYRGVKHLTGTGDSEKYSIQIQGLINKIETLNKSQKIILEDIDYQSERLNNLIEKMSIKDANSLEIQKKLMNTIIKIRNLNQAGKESCEDSLKYEYEVILRKLPEELNIEQYKQLSAKNIRKEDFDNIVLNMVYTDLKEETIATISQSVSLELLEQTHKILEEIGYYSTKAQLSVTAEKTVGSAKEGINNVVNSDIAKKGISSLKSFMKKGK